MRAPLEPLGKAVYEVALGRGHEGVLAKHLTSTYRPGRRSGAWRNIKPRLNRGELLANQNYCLSGPVSPCSAQRVRLPSSGFI